MAPPKNKEIKQRNKNLSKVLYPKKWVVLLLNYNNLRVVWYLSVLLSYNKISVPFSVV